jgi:hypothetical protein
MACELMFSETAVEDLQRIVDSLPLERQERALETVEAQSRSPTPATRGGGGADGGWNISSLAAAFVHANP